MLHQNSSKDCRRYVISMARLSSLMKCKQAVEELDIIGTITLFIIFNFSLSH